MTDKQYSNLDRYFRHKMSASESAAFLRQIASDQDLKEAYDIRRYTAAAVQKTAVKELREKYENQIIGNSISHDKQTTKIHQLSWLRYAAAASILLLLGLLSWWVSERSPTQGDRIFALHDSHALFPKTAYALVNDGLLHKGIINARELSDLRIKGLEAYRIKDWDTAIRLLTRYLKETQVTEEETYDEINLIHLYTGRAWLEKSEYKKSITELQKANAGITDLDNYGLLRELIRWQLVLAYVKDENFSAAKDIGYSLTEAQTPLIRQQVKKLLNDLP